MNTLAIQFIALCLVAACWMAILAIPAAIGFGCFKAWHWYQNKRADALLRRGMHEAARRGWLPEKWL